jgi:hypothetical protein
MASWYAASDRLTVLFLEPSEPPPERRVVDGDSELNVVHVRGVREPRARSDEHEPHPLSGMPDLMHDAQSAPHACTQEKEGIGAPLLL